MAETERVELTVLGQTLSVRSAAPPAHLRALAAYLDERVSALHKGGVRDTQTALLMAALDITDELFRAREERAREEHEVSERLDALRALLDGAVPPVPHP